MFVQSFGGKPLTLCENIAVEVGQDGRIKADTVLNQQDHLHAGGLNILLDIHLVFNEFDDRKDKICVA